jgi:hypothetical protein
MKAAVLPAFALAGLVALAAGAGTPRAATPAPNGAGTHAKASSFAPHAHSRRHVYGAPIQPRIVSPRTRHKHRAGDSPPK